MLSSNRVGLIRLLVGDGRPLLAVTGLALLGSGLFALFLGVRKEFLPHDVEFLGMTPQSLCAIHECRIVHFMIHDRIAFGGALAAIGLMYLWLTAEPLAAGERWAWWLFVVTGVQGFLSFLTYLGYGYLDTWHGIATLVLLPLYVTGLAVIYPRLSASSDPITITARVRNLSVGRKLLLATSAGMIGGGLTICVVGMSSVFVPEDLAFLGLTRNQLNEINPRLIPLIAHDRAGFGGSVCCCGLALAGVATFAEWTVALRQTLLACGSLGFGTALFVHPAIGYTDWWHLTPAVTGAGLFFGGLAMTTATRPT
jgi:hypothetical protein